MGFALAPPLVLAADVEAQRLGDLRARVRMLVAANRFFGNRVEPQAFNTAGGARKELVDELAIQADRFEDLAPR